MARYRLDEGFLRYLKETGAHKVAFFQDEYFACQRRFAFLNEYEIDCVYTCLEPDQFDQVYGRYTRVPQLVSTLTGYVSDHLLDAAGRFAKPDSQRLVDVGYRGRPLPAYLGRGAQEKTLIGERFAERAAGSGLRLDIAGAEADRLYGDDWYRFLADCRCFSGSSREPPRSTWRGGIRGVRPAARRRPRRQRRRPDLAGALGPRGRPAHDQPAAFRGGRLPDLSGSLRGPLRGRDGADAPLHPAGEGLLEPRRGAAADPRSRGAPGADRERAPGSDRLGALQLFALRGGSRRDAERGGRRAAARSRRRRGRDRAGRALYVGVEPSCATW